MRKLIWIIGGLLILAGLAMAGEKKDKGKISGYMFGDVYYMTKNHLAELESRNGIWFRRIYFTYDRKLTDAWSTRMRLEMGTPDGFSDNADKAVPFIKDAYLKYKFNHQQLLLGISPTPSFQLLEKVWGYRSVEKTPLDLQKMASSRDFGLAAKGKLGSSGNIVYHLMLANGNSNKSDNNKGKKVMLAIGFYPVKKFVVEVYGDWNDLPGSTDWYTVQGFAGYKSKTFRAGVQYAHQIRQQAGTGDMTLDIGSLFAVIKAAPRTHLFARVDRLFDPNPSGKKISYLPMDSDAKATLFIVGVDYSPVKNVYFMPNLEAVVYDAPAVGETPDPDVLPRLTFFYKF